MMKANDIVILNANEMAESTQGRWLGNISNLEVCAITNGILNSHISGGLFIIRNPENWGEGIPNTIDKIPQIIARGIAAIVIEESDFRVAEKYQQNVPFLLVKNTRIALFDIAKASSKKSQHIKKVQITGTEGKTSFKYFLSSLSSKQAKVFFQESSANMQVPILLSLANIKVSTEISVIEISCPAQGLGKNRSQLITPDIAIITNVNPSHLNSHGGLSNLIANKAESVLGLKKNGYCLVNHDTKNFDLLINEIKKLRDDIQIKTYGNSIESDSYVISSNFTRLGWDVDASILGQHVRYRINQVQEHSPAASVGILMVIALLGLSVQVAAKDFKTVANSYKSSGSINELFINEKDKFIFYDQHFSVTEVAMQSALNDIKRINVKGKKIAVISGEYNSDQFTKEVHLRIGQYLNDSDIDILYTVGDYIGISTAILHDKTIHKGHFDNIQECTEAVLPIIGSGDLLFIKGMTKLNFEYLARTIYKQFS